MTSNAMKQKKVLKLPVYIAVYVAVIAVCILADQLTKLWIFDGLLGSTEGNSVKVMGNFMRFTATYNEGAIFGMFKGRASDIVFFIITVAATPLYAYFLMRARTRSVCGQVGFAFIVGGAIGNAIDRAFVCTDGAFFSGKVRDFISFSIFPPIFNVADSFLTVGVVLAVLAIVVFDPDSLVNGFGEERAVAEGDETQNADGQTTETQTDNDEVAANDDNHDVTDSSGETTNDLQNAAETGENAAQNSNADNAAEEAKNGKNGGKK